jgi:O-antigen ligase
MIVVAALALHAPTHLAHEWQAFKRPNEAAARQNDLARFGAASGGGRYQYWVAAVHATSGHVLGGSGPGTFQLLWLPRETVGGYVVNAHSLYVETLATVGVIGLALLVGFFVLVIWSAFRLATRTRYEARSRAAAVAAACVAFAIAAAFDWIWQVPVLPVAFLLLAAGVLTPTKRASSSPPRRLALTVRAGIVIVAVACIVVIGVPLAATSAVRQSQDAANAGNTSAALADAREAIRLEPGAASPEIQAALVLELRHDITGAAAAARQATLDEPANWQTWLVYSRLEAEAGHPTASVTAYVRARSLNPRSPLFRQ